MIDKNGKLFGKVNLIDLLIVIVLVAVVGFLGYRFLIRDDTGVVNTQTVYISFTDEEVPNYVADELEVGVNVLDSTENNSMGTVTDFTLDEACSYEVNELGETVALHRPDCASVTITAEVNATLSDNGVIINGTRYAIGHSMVIYVGECKLYTQISGLEAA